MLQTPHSLDNVSLNISPNLYVLTETGKCFFVKAAWTRIMLRARIGIHFKPYSAGNTLVRVLADSWSSDKWTVTREWHISVGGRQESISLLCF